MNWYVVQRKEVTISSTRKKYSAREKVRLLRVHLIEKEPVSHVCDRHGLNPNVFCRWQKVFFENGTAAFNQVANGRKESHAQKWERQNTRLKAKLAGKDEVIPWIMASHVQLKRSWRGLRGSWAEPKRSLAAMTPNPPQPEKLAKLKGKHRNEMNLDNNEITGNNTAGRRNGPVV